LDLFGRLRGRSWNARVAGCHGHLCPAAAEHMGEGVLSPPTANDADLHGLRREPDGLVAARADTDVAHGHACERLPEGDVVPGRLGQLRRPGPAGEVGV